MKLGDFFITCFSTMAAVVLISCRPDSGGLSDVQEESPGFLRLLALGEQPPWREKWIDGRRVSDPLPWGTPPNGITLVSGDESTPLSLGMRSFTKVFEIAGSTQNLELKADDQPWFSEPLPEVSLGLAVLYADQDTMKWDKPKVLVLEDDPEFFKPGEIRFVNLSDKTALVKLGAKAFGISPGKASIKSIKAGGTEIMVGYLDGQDQIVIFHDVVKLRENERVQTFFYKARNPSKNRMVGFHLEEESLAQMALLIQ